MKIKDLRKLTEDAPEDMQVFFVANGDEICLVTAAHIEVARDSKEPVGLVFSSHYGTYGLVQEKSFILGRS